MSNLLRKRYPFVGPLVTRYYACVERSLLRRADQVICICDDFADYVHNWGVDPNRCNVIENWASREEIAPLPADNEWSRMHGLSGKTVFLYAGTLSIKHDPDILLQLARANICDSSFVLVVASEGPGADWLREQVCNEKLETLKILPFQPYEVLPQMLAAASVLVALIEPHAAQFSVPSKILSYMAAGRAVLLSAPASNFGSRLLEKANAGIVTPPGDLDTFLRAAAMLVADEVGRERYAANARHYAEENFDIRALGDRFQTIIEQAIKMPRSGSSRARRGHEGNK
jgi:glycosyltransferase involved in cell wall biosynthesis